MIANLGSGHLTYPDAVNVDSTLLPGVDIVHDLDLYPWPFDTESCDEVWASHLFEHIADPVAFMREAHRILKPYGLLHLAVPHWQSENAFTDPTHRRYCTPRTWDYWCAGELLYEQFGDQYADGRVFIKENVVRHEDDLLVYLRRA